MNNTKQLYLAKQFQELHHRNKMFILPNAWDVGSAVICEKSNFLAIRTTSAGFAYSLGYSAPTPYLENLDIQIKKIQAISNLKEKLGIPFVINARTCVFFIKAGKEDERLSIAIERGNAFHKSGADCVFVPGAIEEGIISKLLNHDFSYEIANRIFSC